MKSGTVMIEPKSDYFYYFYFLFSILLIAIEVSVLLERELISAKL